MPKPSKVVIGGKTIIDLTGDTVKDSALLVGYTATGADGERVVGTCTYDLDTSGATATKSEILAGKTAGVRGSMETGTMPSNGAVTITVSDVHGDYPIPYGHHDGGGMVVFDPAELAKCTPENIRQGVTLFGIQGGMSGSEGVKSQAKEVMSSFEDQVVLPDTGFTHMSQVTVKAVPVTTTDNAAGGQTVTIG